MLFFIFTISASAEEMTASEVVKFYHNILKETAESHELIQVSEDYETIAWAYEEDGKIIIEAWVRVQAQSKFIHIQVISSQLVR